MKVTYHIPTEQHGFVEVEVDDFSLPYDEAKAQVLGKSLSPTEGGPGLSEPDFRVILDKYMTTRTMTSEEYEAMNAVQQNIIQCLKRAYKRQNND